MGTSSKNLPFGKRRSTCVGSAQKFMYMQNDATAPLRVSFILKPAAPDIISRRINRPNRDAVSSSPCSENFDHLILMSLDSDKCQSKLGQSRRSVAVDPRDPVFLIFIPPARPTNS